MTPELKWLALTAVMTTVMWIPYILNQISVRGLMAALGYQDDPKPLDAWAIRLKKAHYNSIENLVVFGVLVLIAHLAEIHTSWTVLACVVYFWARLFHAIVYAAGIPVVRTLTFAVSWLCIIVLAGSVLI
ncbi:MAG: MAPEG family protein [Acidiferrobacterales bacterium]|nr:MAPEG family protein [Acidiferrobacterales bacterium]